MGKIILSEGGGDLPVGDRSVMWGIYPYLTLVRRWEGWMCLTERILEVSHKGEKKKD